VRTICQQGEKDARGGGMNLKELLSLPLHHLNESSSILKEILKWLPKTNVDRRGLSKVTKKLRKVSSLTEHLSSYPKTDADMVCQGL